MPPIEETTGAAGTTELADQHTAEGAVQAEGVKGEQAIPDKPRPLRELIKDAAASVKEAEAERAEARSKKSLVADKRSREQGKFATEPAGKEIKAEPVKAPTEKATDGKAETVSDGKTATMATTAQPQSAVDAPASWPKEKHQ